MDIGIIGSGNIGATAARLFASAGHRVVISNSRGPESLRQFADEAGPNVRAASVEEAADFGEVVLVAIPFFAYETLPADQLAGKVVIDAMNYYAGRDGPIAFDGRTSSELVARHLPGSRLVKAFNTMYYETLATEGRPGSEDRLVLFVAGDDGRAKSVVSRLIEEIGFAPVDTGSLQDGGRKQEPGSPIYNVPMTYEEAREAARMTDTAEGRISFLRGLRAVRSFRLDPLPQKVVDDVLEVARWTGSATNRQPWELVVIRDRRTLEELAGVEGYARHLAGAALGIVLVMAGERSEQETFDEGRLAERIMLAAHAHSVGSCVGWFVGDGVRKVKEILGIPAKRRVRTAVSLGYPEERSRRVRRRTGPARKPLSEIVHEERYG